MNEVKHPQITVELIGRDGNAYAILAAVRKAMRRARLEREEIDAFVNEATSGDYDHLLYTCMKWVNVI